MFALLLGLAAALVFGYGACCWWVGLRAASTTGERAARAAMLIFCVVGACASFLAPLLLS